MPKIRDLVGKKYGKLTVIKRVGSKKTGPNSYSPTWECLCDCGNTKIVDSHSLVYTHTSSCGCRFSHRDRSVPALHSLMNKYKQRSKKKNIEFSLTEEEFRNITSANCYYCGCPPRKVTKEKCNSKYTYNGIDRIDPLKGYTLENSRTSCWRCNAAKNDMSEEDFINWINQVYSLQTNKN